MITARLADSYNRDVFALPGRVLDKGSGGCHLLIKSQKAQLITEAEDLIDALGWKDAAPKMVRQKELFVDLSAEERQLVHLLEESQTLHIDELNIRSGLQSSTLAASLLSLELQGIIRSLPGKQYQLC